ncbi:MAG: TonB-dependent copper receptor [Parashewanella sp.]
MFKLSTVFLAVNVVLSNLAVAAGTPSTPLAPDAVNDNSIEHIVVTGEYMQQPTTVSTDPKQPRLPLPAYDGAGFLKTINGFSIGRKGGAGGDPSLRGLGGSRINIIDDGQHAYGTCGGRMDPPTAYIYPEAYERIEVIKGPQTVKYGPVGSAGTVLFEKEHSGFTEATVEGRASATLGSFGRRDFLTEFKGGNETGYLELELNRSESDHYKDGDGNSLQSKYDRNNSNLAVGWTPSQDTIVELSYGKSAGSAEYADRANKGRVIENENYDLLVEHDFTEGVLEQIQFQVYSNRTNHIMDQFDQGKNKGINVRRATQGGHVWFDFNLSDDFQLTTGMDFMNSKHEGRKADPAANTGLDGLLKKAFQDNLKYNTFGVFAEADYSLDTGKLLSGIRLDHWQTELLVAQKGTRKDDLVSGFIRYELSKSVNQYYAGVGYSQRIPDYWEMMKMKPGTKLKSFDLAPEKTSQLDIGWIYDDGINFSSSLYFGKVKDYILIDTTKGWNARNIDATIWGGELGLTIPLMEHLSTQVIMSYSYGNNDTDSKPLGQVSPLESKISLDYAKDDWSFGLLWRLVAPQNRVAVGTGNIAGRDLGKSHGFGTLAMFAGWKPTEQFSVNLGIENVLNKTYAEHISRPASGNDVPDSVPLFQVNEPGRNLWLKANYTF